MAQRSVALRLCVLFHDWLGERFINNEIDFSIFSNCQHLSTLSFTLHSSDFIFSIENTMKSKTGRDFSRKFLEREQKKRAESGTIDFSW